MSPHVWEVFEGDAGQLGAYDYNECVICGAQGGIALAWKRGKPWLCFFSDGPARQHLELPADDCDESQRLIAEFLARGQT